MTIEIANKSTIGVEIATLATEYADLKVPYQHRGTSRNGCDCTGLIIGICREMGYLKSFELRQYPPDWNLHSGAGNYIIEELHPFGRFIEKSVVEVGDIALMRFGKCPAHAGIIVSDDLVFVHALKTNRYCKKSVLKNSSWSARWIMTFRFCEEKLNSCCTECRTRKSER